MADKKYTIKIDTKGVQELKANVDKVTFTLGQIPKTIERIARQLKMEPETKNKYLGRKAFRTKEPSSMSTETRDARRALAGMERLIKKLGNDFYNILPPKVMEGEGAFNLTPSKVSESSATISAAIESLEISTEKATPKIKSFKKAIESLGAEAISSMSTKDLTKKLEELTGKVPASTLTLLKRNNVQTADYAEILQRTVSKTKQATKATKERVLVDVKSEKEITRSIEKRRKEEQKLLRQREQEARRDELLENVFSTDTVKGSGKNAKTTQLRGAAGSRGAAGRDMSSLAGIANSDSRGIVAAYATLAANVFAITTAFQQLSEAAKFDQLEKGLIQLGASSGQTFSVMTRGLRDITGLAINTRDAMKSVALATSAGLESNDIERLGRVAKGASIALGRNLGDAMDRLSRGAIKLEPEILDELGIMIRLDDAVESYANQLGKAKSSLTAYERRQAFLVAVLEQGERKFGDIADSVDVSPYDKLTSSLQDSSVALSRLLNKVLSPMASLFANNPALLAAPFTILASVVADKVLPNFSTLKKKAAETSEILSNQTIPFNDTKEKLDSSILKDRAKMLSLYANENRAVTDILRKNKQLEPIMKKLLTFGEVDLETYVDKLQLQKNILVKNAAEIRSRSVITRRKAEELKATEDLIDATDLLIKKEQKRIRNNTEIIERKNKQALNKYNALDLGAFESRISTASGLGIQDTLVGYANYLKAAANNSANFYREQNTNIDTTIDLLGSNATMYDRLRARSGKTLSAMTAGWEFTKSAARGASIVVSKFIPIVGTLATVAAVATAAFKFLFEDSSVKAYNKALKDTSEIVSQLNDKWQNLDKVQSRAGTTADDFAQKYIILSNVSSELNESFNKLLQTQRRLTKISSRPLRFFDDSTLAFLGSRGLVGSFGGGNIEDIFFGAKPGAIKKLNKQLREAPEEYIKVLEEAKEAVGGFNSAMSKKEQIETAARILKLANKQYENLNKILPELQSNFSDVEREIRSFNTAVKPSTSIDGIVESFKALENVTKALGNSSINEKAEILTRYVSESSEGLRNLLNLSPDEAQTLRTLDELNDKLKKSRNIAEKFSIYAELYKIDPSMDSLFDKISKSTEDLQKFQRELVLIKNINSKFESESGLAKALDQVNSKSKALEYSMTIITNNVITATKELELMKNTKASSLEIESKELEIMKLKFDLQTLITIGQADSLNAELEVLKLQKAKTADLKTRRDLINNIEKAERRLQVISAGGSNMSSFENEFISNIDNFRNKQLAINVEIASSNEEMQTKLIKIHQLEQDLAEARLKSNGYVTEFITSKEKELQLTKNQLDLSGLRIKLIQKEAEVAKQSLIPTEEKLSTLRKQADNLKAIAELEASRVDASRELNNQRLLSMNAVVGINGLTPEQEIESRKQELRDRISSTKAINTAEQSIISLKNNQLDVETNLRRLELEAIRARFELLKKDSPGSADFTKIDSMFSIIEQTEQQIYASVNRRTQLEQNIASIRAESAQEALQTEIALGNAGNRFLNSQAQSLAEQRDILREGRGFIAQLPFIGTAYSNIFDSFRNTTGRVPTNDELNRIKQGAVYYSRISAQLEAQSTLSSSLESSFDTLFDSITSGNDKVAESFKKMAISIVADLAKVYTKALIVSAITSTISGFGIKTQAIDSSTVDNFGGAFGKGFYTPSTTPAFATGGVYNNQGIVNKPMYLAGEGKYNEAIVPLPNGKSIPVDMKTAGPSTNNVNVSINLTGEGSSMNSDNMSELGNLVSKAILKELQEQKRPGGILNKYGAS